VRKRPRAAERAYRQALALREKLADDCRDVPLYRENWAHAQDRLRNVLEQSGRLPEAEDALRSALARFRALATECPTVHAYRQSLATTLSNLANLLEETSRFAGAEKTHREGLRHRARLAAELPTIPSYRLRLGHSHFNLGILLLNTRQLPKAKAELTRAHDLFTQLHADFPTVPSYRQDLAAACNSLGNLLLTTSQYQEAEKTWQRAVKLQKELVNDFPEEDDYRFELAMSLSNMGLLLAHDLGRLPRAEEQFRQACDLLQKLVTNPRPRIKYHGLLGETQGELARLLFQEKKNAEGRRILEQAVSHLRTAHQGNPKHARYAGKLRSNAEFLVRCLVFMSDHAAAAKAAEELPKLFPERGAGHFLAGRALALCVLSAHPDAKLARQYGDRAVQLLKESRQKGFKDLNTLKTDLAFEALRKRDDFRKWLEELDR